MWDSLCILWVLGGVQIFGLVIDPLLYVHLSDGIVKIYDAERRSSVSKQVPLDEG